MSAANRRVMVPQADGRITTVELTPMQCKAVDLAEASGSDELHKHPGGFWRSFPSSGGGSSDAGPHVPTGTIEALLAKGVFGVSRRALDRNNVEYIVSVTLKVQK